MRKSTAEIAFWLSLILSSLVSSVGNTAESQSCESIFSEVNLSSTLRDGVPKDLDGRMAVEQKLHEIEAQLKVEFTGMSPAIEQLMSALRLMVFYGDRVVTKPPVVVIQGPPGYGKTMLIQRWLKLTRLEDIYVQEMIKKEQMYIPFEKIIGRGRPVGESAELSARRPLMDFILNIDETQYLKNAADVDQFIKETSEATPEQAALAARVGTSQAGLVDTIKKSRSFWWEVLGNGIYQVQVNDPTDTLQGVLNQLPNTTQAEDTVIEYRSRLAKLNAEKELKPDDPNIDPQIVQAKSSLANAEKNYRAHFNYLRPSLVKLKADCSISLGEQWSSLSVQELYETIREGSEEFGDVVMANYKAAAMRTVQEKFRGIVIITGNPEDLIAAATAKAVTASGKVDAEALRRAAMAGTDAEAINYFVKKIGAEPGWQSRLNASKWKMLPPFGEKQWRELIRQSFERFKDLTIEEGKLYTGKDIEITIDETLVDYMYKAAVSPLDGPRAYFESLNAALAVLPTQAPLQMRQYMLKNSAWEGAGVIKLKVSFSTESHQLIIEEPGGHFVSKLELPMDEAQQAGGHASMNFPPIAKAQQALYQAARIVVGSIVFRSMPRQAIEIVPTAEDTVDSLWSRPDVNFYDHLKNKMLVSISGYIAERVALDESGVDISPNAKIDLDYTASMLASLRSEMDRRQELHAYSRGSDEKNLRAIFGRTLAEDQVMISIHKQDFGAAYLALDTQVRKIMNEQKFLINALATNLLDHSRLTPEEVHSAFEIYAKRPGLPTNTLAIVRRALGGKDVSLSPRLDVGHIVKNVPGSIQNPLTDLENPYSLTHREFKTTILGRFLDRISAAVR